MQFSMSLSVLALVLSVTLLLQGCDDDAAGGGGDAAGGGVGTAGCSDSSKVCAQIKPLGAGRRLGVPYMSNQTEFGCKAGSEATCDASMCTADKFRIQGAFMITDEDQGRDANPAWAACGHVSMIWDGEQQRYDLDFACGCADEAEYLAQVHSDDTASCGIVVIGLDVYTQNEGWGDSSQTMTIDGEEWVYIPQDDLAIAPDIVTMITGVKDGTQAAGVHTYGYTYDMPRNGESGCQVTYRVDITVPESYAV